MVVVVVLNIDKKKWNVSGVCFVSAFQCHRRYLLWQLLSPAIVGHIILTVCWFCMRAWYAVRSIYMNREAYANEYNAFKQFSDNFWLTKVCWSFLDFPNPPPILCYSIVIFFLWYYSWFHRSFVFNSKKKDTQCNTFVSKYFEIVLLFDVTFKFHNTP